MLIMDKKFDNLYVYVFDTRDDMGKAAAQEAAAQIRSCIALKGEANVIFASAPSQSDMLKSLIEQDIDWQKVRGFYQDEYIGLSLESPAGFGNFLRRHVFDHKSLLDTHFLECSHSDVDEKISEYSALLEKYPPDLIFLGVGENGHLAFNEPDIADLKDPLRLKVVELDVVSRQQQVNDGCFASLDEVPTHAITLTLSQIMAVECAIAVVPTKLKENAVDAALNGPVTTDCPASALRLHPNAKLYLDKCSAGKGLLNRV